MNKLTVKFLLFLIILFNFSYSFSSVLTVGTDKNFTNISSALSTANAGDTIDVFGTITGDGVAFNGIILSKNITIRGQGKDNTIVQGSTSLIKSDRRVFSITNGAIVKISSLTIRNGNVNGNGGGIENLGNLILFNCNIDSCKAKYGGGIRNGIGGVLTILFCEIRNNEGTLRGGGINHIGSLMTIENCAISNNKSIEEGGGIQIENANATISNSLIYKNMLTSGQVKTNGAGIFIGNSSFMHLTTLKNVTISANTPEPAAFDSCCGGGIGMITTSGQSSLSLVNCTITDNNAFCGKGIQAYSYNAGSENVINILNCIISNTSGNYFEYKTSGSTISLQRNYTIVDDLTMPIGGMGNMNGTDPEIEPLANNGGPTWTHALKITSPAIDAGSETGSPLTDQRGATRYNKTDIGSFEYNGIFGMKEKYNNNIVLYPNPASNYIIVETIYNPSILSLMLTDLQGKIILSEQITKYKQKICVPNIQNGLYIIRITDIEGNFITSKKIMIQNTELN